MNPKEADAMANSVDPDQTASSEAVWSWSALFAETYLSQYIEFLRYCFHWESNGLACSIQSKPLESLEEYFMKRNTCYQ